MRWKDNVRDYLTYSRRERLGLLILLLITVCAFLLPTVINNKQWHQNVAADTAWIAAMKRLMADTNDAGLTEPASRPERRPSTHSNLPVTLFYFDPNHLDEKGWLQLGISERTARTIINFVSKGGYFRKTADLRNIYGLKEEDYLRIEKYVRIEEKEKEKQKGKERGRDGGRKIAPVDVNRADTSAFIALPGIGGKLAARIVNFREKLGGFYSLDQVGETFGLADSVFQRIRPFLTLENALVRKINVNTASLDDLKAHPYIRFAIARAIIAYRKEHGPFDNVVELKNVMAITPAAYEKMAPYVTAQ